MSGRPPPRYPHPWGARLRGPTAFKAVLSSKRLHTPNFTVAFKTSTGTAARLGLVVGRRASKSAVERNRLKRLVRESFRHRRPSLPAIDVVVTVRASAVPCRGGDLLQELTELWNRLCRSLGPSAG